MDLLIEFAIGNLFVSLALAGVAYAVHRQGRVPFVAHLLWVLVLAKLLTPPLLVAPLLPGGPSAVASAGSLVPVASDALPLAVAVVLLVWAIGSAAVLSVSILRIRRFDALITSTSAAAPVQLQWLAADVGERLGMRRVPTVYLTSARLSPLTWWTGRAVRVVLPATLLPTLGSDQLRMVLAHELGHVKRRDYLVRWLEWLACVTFWWNPVVWFARNNLRIDEEAACDALVVQRLGSGARPYAGALLAVVEHLAHKDATAPAVATGIDGGSMEKRFRRILSGRGAIRPPRWLVPAVLMVSLLVLPLGVGQAGSVLESPSSPSPQVLLSAPQGLLSAPPAAAVSTAVTVDDVPTARLSATIKPKAAAAKDTKKAKAAKKKRAARKARRERRAARAAALESIRTSISHGLVLRH